MANSEGLHEPEASLSPEIIDRHRAFTSLQEELEAADWYDQRVKATKNGELASILAHNRDEEKEHAMMLLEWLRRQDPVLDEHMRTYLFTEGPITEIEARAEGKESGEEDEDGTSEMPSGERPGSPESLGLGSMKGQS